MWLTKIKPVAAALVMVAGAGGGAWQARTWAQAAPPPIGVGSPAAAQPAPVGGCRVTVTDVIREDDTVVCQVGVEAPPGATVELLVNQAARSSLSASVGETDRTRVQFTLFADHVSWANRAKSVVKFSLGTRIGKTTSSTSEADELPAGAKRLADVLTVSVKPGEYPFGKAVPLATFKDRAYSLLVRGPK